MPSPRSLALRTAAVAGIGFILGVVTSYAQGWLPPEVGSIANSSGTWSLAAFLLALPAVNQRNAAFFGFLSLVTLLAGYTVALAHRGYPAGTALVAFWTLAALVAGPLLGLGGYWLRTGRGYRAALGAGGMAGLLIGEGLYGLLRIAHTTYPPYWWGEVAVGVALLGWACLRRLVGWRAVAVAVGASVVVAAAFEIVYSLDLISVVA